MNNNENVSKTLCWLTRDPHPYVLKHFGFFINDFTFLTKSHDENQVAQNYGVSVVAETLQVVPVKDKNSMLGDITY